MPDVTSQDAADLAAQQWIPMAPGMKRRTLSCGSSLHQVLVHFEHGTPFATHQHPHEQVTHVIRGRLRLVVGGVERELSPGDSINIPGNVPHGGVAVEESLVTDTFTPPREDILAKDREALTAATTSQSA